jgi:hypothetical protein
VVCTSYKDTLTKGFNPEGIQKHKTQVIVGVSFCMAKGRMPVRNKLSRHNMYGACPKHTEDTLKEPFTVLPLDIPQAVRGQEEQITTLRLQMPKIKKPRAPSRKPHI